MDTIPENSTPINPRMQGLDYLWFWAFGRFEDAVAFYEVLNVKMDLAKREERPVFFTLGGVEFSIRSYGSGPAGIYRNHFQLESRGVYLGVLSPKNLGNPSRPQFKIEVKGATLTRFGEKKVFELVKSIFKAIGFNYVESKIKRVDIRNDFESFTPHDVYELVHNGHQVTAAHKYFPVMGPSFKCETFQVGSRSCKSDIVLRIYDKLAEVGENVEKQQSLEAYVLGVPFEDCSCLTRVEYELDVKALRDRWEVHSVEDLLGSVERICEDLTSKFFRLHDKKVDRENNNQSHSGALHRIWEMIEKSFKAFGSAFGERKLPKAKERKMQSSHEARNTTLGYLAKLAVLDGAKINTSTDFVSFIVDQFLAVGGNLAWFNARIAKKRKEVEQRALSDALAFFENRSIVQQPLFEVA